MGMFGRSLIRGTQQQPKTAAGRKQSPCFDVGMRQHSCGLQVACVNMEAVTSAPADVLFNLLADPTKHVDLFPDVKSVRCRLLEEDGPRRKYEMDTQAQWSFGPAALRIRGQCETKMWLESDSNAGTVTFKLREPGFLEVFECTWRIYPAHGATALNQHSRLQQALAGRVSPSRARSEEHPAPLQQQAPWSPAFPVGDIGQKKQEANNSDSSHSCLASVSAQPLSKVHAQPHSIVRVEEMMMRPKVAPPAMMTGMLTGQVLGQATSMLHGLLDAAMVVHAECSGASQP